MRPVAAQNSEIFCETIPASIAPHSGFNSGGPNLKRETSDTRMICMGGLDGGGGGGGGGPLTSFGLGGGVIMICDRKSPSSTGIKA